jgi:hypothetical protein
LVLGDDEVERPDAGLRDHPSEGARSHRQQRAFDQGLADDTPATCAECHANGDIAHPRHGAGQEKVGDVRRRYQQEQPGGAEHRQKDGRRLWPEELLVERAERKRHSAVRQRIRAFEFTCERLELGSRDPLGRVRREVANHEEIPDGTVVSRRRPDEWPPHFGEIPNARKRQAARHDTDHGRGNTVQANGPADQIRISSVPAFP